MKRIAVVGGGISGIAAAWTIAHSNSDFEVVLFEASNRLGGVLNTIHDGDYLVEESADNFATLIPDALELCRESGYESELIQPNATNRQAFVVNRGRLLPIPLGFSLMQPTRLAALLATKTLSWKGKLRVLGEYWVNRRESDDDESLESFVSRRLGREAFENLVEPIVSGIFTADPRTLSMQATMRQFVEMEKRHGGLIRGAIAARKHDAAAAAKRASGARYDQFVAPRNGMSHWISHLASQLPSECPRISTPVQKVNLVLEGEDNTAWNVVTSTDSLRFDGLVLALPAKGSGALLEGCLPDAARVIRRISYASSVVVAMIVNQADVTGRTDGFGLIVPRREKRQALAISYSSNKYSGRVPAGEVLFRIFVGGALAPDMVNLSDEELFAIANSELRELLGWQGKQANWKRVIRWPNAMPQYELGHTQRMQELHALLESQPTLKLCGAAFEGVGIPQCVRGGRQAAHSLMAFLKARRQS